MDGYFRSGAWWPEAIVLAVFILPGAVLTGNFGFAFLGSVFLGLGFLGPRRDRKLRAVAR